MTGFSVFYTPLSETDLPVHGCPPAGSAAPSCPPEAAAPGPVAPHTSLSTAAPSAAAPA